jgi:hypothetical protein
MKDQHTKIKGYRDLSQREIDLMNRLKGLGDDIEVIITELQEVATVAEAEQADQRCVALAKTNIQQGMMWAIRSVAKPASFC